MSPPPPVSDGTPERPVLAAGVVLWRPGNEGPEFLLLENALHGTWGFAKGHIEAGEDLLQAAMREVEEETGMRLDRSQVRADFADTSLYPVPEDGWKRVVMFLAEAPDQGRDFRQSPEHRDAGWFDIDTALNKLSHDALRRTLCRAAARLEA